MRSRIVSSALLGALLAALPARAEPTATERAMADSLFGDAKKLLARGKIPEACEKLAASYRIDPAGGTLINLAKCHEIEGKTATAWTEFGVALAAARKASRPDREKAAREHMTALEPRLSRITVTVPAGAAAGLEVKLDGVTMEASALGTPIPVDPGEHTASAAAPDKKPWETKVSLKEAESRSLAVPALEAAGASLGPAPPPPLGWKKPAGIAAAAAGALLIGVGTGFGVRAITLGSRAAGECPNQLCTPAGLGDVNDGRSAAAVANGTVVAGALLAAGGAALLILNAVSGPESPGAGDRPASSWRIAPAVGPGVGFVVAQGAF